MITVLLALATVAVDPGAKPAPVASTAASTAVAVTAPAAPAADPARRFCINDTLTGTRLARKVCLTRQEWHRRGVDLPN